MRAATQLIIILISICIRLQALNVETQVKKYEVVWPEFEVPVSGGKPTSGPTANPTNDPDSSSFCEQRTAIVEVANQLVVNISSSGKKSCSAFIIIALSAHC
jgi:hypothetical protein